MAASAPALAPADPLKNRPPRAPDAADVGAGGSARHPLGTDTLGRDVLSRLLYGARVSLMVGLAAVIVAGAVGVALGLVAGYYGGWRDDVAHARWATSSSPFPSCSWRWPSSRCSGAGLVNLVLVLGVSGWITYARIVRGETLSLKQREFVEAARALGALDGHVIWRHLFPNVCAPITVVATFSVARTIIAEASLSFLGLGVPPPTPSWGAMLDEGRNYITTGWWLALFPGLAILIWCSSSTSCGDWLRDALDPRMERGMRGNAR